MNTSHGNAVSPVSHRRAFATAARTLVFAVAALVMSGNPALSTVNAPMLKRTKVPGIRRPGGAAATVAAQVMA